jgi:hypothetical protein
MDAGNTGGVGMMRLQHKFHNVITERDGLKFRSQKEARYYDQLKIMQKMGEVVFFLLQPKFHLPGGVKYSADFVVYKSNGEVEFIDVKGKKTKGYIRNKKLVEAIYPVKIIEK